MTQSRCYWAFVESPTVSYDTIMVWQPRQLGLPHPFRRSLYVQSTAVSDHNFEVFGGIGKSRRFVLPLGVFGISSIKYTPPVSHLCLENLDLIKAWICSSCSSGSFLTTKARGHSPISL